MQNSGWLLSCYQEIRRHLYNPKSEQLLNFAPQVPYLFTFHPGIQGTQEESQIEGWISIREQLEIMQERKARDNVTEGRPWGPEELGFHWLGQESDVMAVYFRRLFWCQSIDCARIQQASKLQKEERGRESY